MKCLKMNYFTSCLQLIATVPRLVHQKANKVCSKADQDNFSRGRGKISLKFENLVGSFIVTKLVFRFFTNHYKTLFFNFLKKKQTAKFFQQFFCYALHYQC